jgi:cysteine desulfuration protein SufE
MLVQVNLSEKQAVLRDKFLAIPDAQDRLAAVVGRKSRLDPLRESERAEANLVPGCVSRVWMVGEVVAGNMRLRVDAEAGIVKGLAMLLCELYDDSAVADAATFEPTLLDELGFARMLTPTRLQGLRQICRRIRALAAQ